MSVAEELVPEISWSRRIISLVVALVVVAGGAFGVYYFAFSGDSSTATTAKPQEAVATKGQLVSTLTTTGTAASTLSSKLTFQGSGQVKSLKVVVGDKVTAGQELARLDDTTAQRKVQTAAANLTTAKLKLQQLTDPPKTSDVAAAQQAVASARGQLANAQTNLANGTTTDLATSDAAVLQAQNTLQSANNTVDTTWASLVNAQRAYCGTSGITVFYCSVGVDVPLSEAAVSALTLSLYSITGPAAQVTAITTATNGLLAANSAYINAKNSVASAQKSLESALAKRKSLSDPNTLTQLQSAVDSATASLAGAQARYDQLMAGPTSTDLALQQQSVTLAQISYQQAVDDADGLVLKAPFDGIIGSIPVNVGDQVGASTLAMTLSNPEGVRVDLTISETDLSGLKTGIFGIVTFDSLPGQIYLVRVSGVSTTPTVTQGVVTYPVQAQILRGPDLAKYAADLQKVGTALTSLGGGGAAARAGATAGQNGAQGGQSAGQGGAGAQRTPGAGTQRTPGAGTTPGAGRTPAAGVTPGQGGFGGAGGAGGTAGAGILQGLANAPMPVAGMNANVIILLDLKEDALLVPTAAVKRQGRTSYVLVIQPDGTTKQQTVGTGGSDNTNTAITTGLNEGDKVLVGVAATAGASRTPTRAAGAGGAGQGPGTFGPAPAGGVR